MDAKAWAVAALSAQGVLRRSLDRVRIRWEGVVPGEANLKGTGGAALESRVWGAGMCVQCCVSARCGIGGLGLGALVCV